MPGTTCAILIRLIFGLMRSGVCLLLFLLSSCALAGLYGPGPQARAREAARKLPDALAQLPQGLSNDLGRFSRAYAEADQRYRLEHPEWEGSSRQSAIIAEPDPVYTYHSESTNVTAFDVGRMTIISGTSNGQPVNGTVTHLGNMDFGTINGQPFSPASRSRTVRLVAGSRPQNRAPATRRTGGGPSSVRVPSGSAMLRGDCSGQLSIRPRPSSQTSHLVQLSPAIYHSPLG
jgi:hypothetical protein